MKVETIKQKTGFDCSIACMAMATGESYEAILNNLNKRGKESYANKEGQYPIDDDELLNKLKFDTEWEELSLNGWIPDCNSAILNVPSKNKEGKMHAVYWDGEKVHDPSPRKTYETEEALRSSLWVQRISPAISEL